MYTVITVLIIIISILLVLIVLVQNSKGGGLASNFSSSNQYMGVRKTADFLEKATWTLAIALVVLSLVSVMAAKPPTSAGSGTDVNKVLEMPVVPTAPAAPEAQPQPGTQPVEGQPAEMPVE